MEAIILCGIQGSGKTTLYRDRWLETHVRVSLDLLRTRHREGVFFTTCLETRQPVVVDNTNPAPEDRARYAVPARAAGYRVVCIVVAATPSDALARNATRAPGRQVPVAGVLGTQKRLVPPTVAEGYDEILRARADPAGGWLIEPIAPPAVV